MTVHFIGVGPGAPDLITLRARDIIAAADIILYAGSLIPMEILGHAHDNAVKINSAPLDLDAITAVYAEADKHGQDVARLHSGDLSIWSAMAEQIAVLKSLNIDYSVTPGVPSFAASAAALGAELTVPNLVQSVVLTRTSGRASEMPASETLEAFAQTGATLAIHLSIHVLEEVTQKLTPFYGADCPCAVIYRASWPDQKIYKGRLSDIRKKLDQHVNRTALILVGQALEAEQITPSQLYASDYDRRFRPQTADSIFADTKEINDG